MKKHIFVGVVLLSSLVMAQDQSDLSEPLPDTLLSPRQDLDFNQEVSKEQHKDLLSHWVDILTFKVEHRSAVTLNYGMNYDPGDDIDFLMVTYHQIYDYQDVVRHKAPKDLRFKLEYAAGLRTQTSPRVVLSFGFFAMYYPSDLETETFRPFVDAGVGLIYTDFQNVDQGFRINFNPQLSIGTEIKIEDGKPFYLAFRAHHLSNGEFHDENRGINSVFIMFGKYF